MPSIPDLSPHALAGLVAIADHGSVSAAARARGLTQPTMSRQLQDLERQLGVQLVERTAQGARLTPAGTTLSDGAREVLAALAALPGRVRGRGDEVAGRVRLGTVDSIGIHVLPPILATFATANPQVQIQVVCQSSPQLMALLLDDELDLAVGTTDHPRLDCRRLFQNPLVLAHHAGMPAAKIPHTLKQLAQHPLITFPRGLTIRTLLDQAFEKAGVVCAPVMELANVEVIKAMVRAGLGLGVIPEGSVVADEVGTARIIDLDVARTIRLLRRRGPAALAVDALSEHLVSALTR
jgi:DNA-binding transcriptional LysR family regulator